MGISKLVLAAAIVAMPMTAQAQYFSNASVPNSDATPFWDVVSDDDGQGCNIGYVLTGAATSATCRNWKVAAGYTAPYNNTTIANAWFAHANGNVNASVGFAFYTGGNAQLTYFGGLAGADPLRSLVIRDLQTYAILYTFSSVNTSYTFTGPGYFDIGIATFTPSSPTPNFFSYSAASPNQFAVFGNGAFGGNSASCGTSGCWVGAEDKVRPSDFDYNDGFLRITGASATTIVPEPSSIILMASGLLGLAVTAARRRRNNA
ncbi:PEP-CTERM sorting domain-containing protein [Gemmatimonas sp.]|uniref:PEP-CTERM sorting domain-containing protein n=1 Tax=Gemmatimonas sp. TaxID=1962908 RepID=UPI00286E9F5B|nr:PEP-CTERM sorting domain-containing protein [Gemmatimonas sp.]